jgi:hypothetical protein
MPSSQVSSGAAVHGGESASDGRGVPDHLDKPVIAKLQLILGTRVGRLVGL